MKMLGKVGSSAAMLAMLSCCLLGSETKEVITKASEDSKIQAPLEIIETTTIEPDAVALAKTLVHSTKLQNGEDNTLQFSQSDAEALMKISTTEAATEGAIGQLKVMRVVMNRVKSAKYPDSIQEVIEQRELVDGVYYYQFCTVREGTYYEVEPNLNAHLALAELEKNIDPEEDIIAFETVSNGKTLEKYFKYKYTYRGHDFYTEK